MFDEICLWQETDISYEFTLQIIVVARMPMQVNYSSQIQFAISFGSSCSVYSSAKTKRSVCGLASTVEGYNVSTKEEKYRVVMFRIFGLKTAICSAFTVAKEMHVLNFAAKGGI